MNGSLDEFRERGAFTALVVLVEIGARSVTPRDLDLSQRDRRRRSTGWRSSPCSPARGVQWDGASFYPVTAPDGGPLDNASARIGLRAIEARVKAERLALNEGFFFDRHGRRMMVEEEAAE